MRLKLQAFWPMRKYLMVGVFSTYLINDGIDVQTMVEGCSKQEETRKSIHGILKCYRTILNDPSCPFSEITKQVQMQMQTLSITHNSSNHQPEEKRRKIEIQENNH